MNVKLPEIGRWYSANELDDIFEVVAIDNDTATGSGAIEIQYFDGEIEAFDLDTWHTLHIENIAQPEDWTGPFELDASDDIYNQDSDSNDYSSDYEPRNDDSIYNYYYTHDYHAPHHWRQGKHH